MVDLIILFFTYFSELLIVYFYFHSIYEMKRKPAVSFTVAFSAYMLLMVVYGYITKNEIVSIILILSANILTAFCGFKCSLRSVLFHTVALLILQYASESGSVYLLAFSMNISSDTSLSDAGQFAMGMVISRIIYLFFTRLLAKISVKEDRSRSWGRWALLALLPVSSIFILLIIRDLTSHIALDFFQSVACLLAICFLLLADIVVYLIYEQSEKNNQKLIELEVENQKNSADMQYLNLLENKNEQMHIMSHDFKNHIFTIEAMTDSQEIKDYLSDMLGEISHNEQTAKTKNRLLDVILNKYTEICADKNIDFKTEIISDNLSFLSPKDLSAIFNNALDNAVESAEKSTERYIGLYVSDYMNNYHRVIIENSCDDTPRSKNGSLLTTKNNRQSHGYGTRSIEKSVKKYNGEMSWEYDENKKIFKLIMLFPLFDVETIMKTNRSSKAKKY